MMIDIKTIKLDVTCSILYVIYDHVNSYGFVMARRTRGATTRSISVPRRAF